MSEMADTLYITTAYLWQCRQLLLPDLRRSGRSPVLLVGACKGDLPAQLNMAAVLVRMSCVELATDIPNGGSDGTISDWLSNGVMLLEVADIMVDAVQVCRYTVTLTSGTHTKHGKKHEAFQHVLSEMLAA